MGWARAEHIVYGAIRERAFTWLQWIMSIEYLKWNITKESGRPVILDEDKPDKGTRKLCLVSIIDLEERKRILEEHDAIRKEAFSLMAEYYLDLWD